MDREQRKIMLGFVVRQCAVALGHDPSPGELAEWANNQRDARGEYRLFGRPISEADARAILRHPDRIVAVRRIRLAERSQPPLARPTEKVIILDAVRSRRAR